MKKLNKAMSVAVAAAMMVSMGACGNSADAAKDGTQSAGASGKVYNIGICQQLEHPALDQATQGFEDALKEKLGDNVKFDLQNAQNEQANASTIANNFVSSNVDLILANATTALQACAAATTDIPILGTSVTDYATALEISDWSGTTGRNISGTSDLAPLDQQEDMLVELYPDAKHVAILYCSAEANSKYQATEFEKYLDEDGISYKEFTASDSNDIGSVVQSATEYADVIYIPTDNTMAQQQNQNSSSPEKAIIRETIDYMKNNLDKTIRIEDFADLNKYSVSHFSKLFRLTTGMSPIEYFIHLKMQKACQLLYTEDSRVKQIAALLGYDDPYYFSRLFKKYMNTSPGTYRKSVRKIH